MRLQVKKWLTAGALGAVVLGLTGACSTCVQEEDRLIVEMSAGEDLADTGAGAQHVRFRAWAVKDRKQFEAASDDALVKDEPKVLVDRGMGDVFESSTSWITPGGSVRLQRNVTVDEQYEFLGLVVLFPEPKRLLEKLDCDERPGYEFERPEHRLVIRLGRDSVQLGAGGKKSKAAED